MFTRVAARNGPLTPRRGRFSECFRHSSPPDSPRVFRLDESLPAGLPPGRTVHLVKAHGQSAENSHQVVRRRERKMQRLNSARFGPALPQRSLPLLQQFNLQRHFVSRSRCGPSEPKRRRSGKMRRSSINLI